MTRENKPVIRAERDTGSGGDPDTADEITILDYVMLDFVDEFFTPREYARRRTLTEPWRVH